ncbi:MAG: VOC family protein [Bacteroidetes bacterium]|nr:VOC family protein [Bacteroidota bacterium]
MKIEYNASVLFVKDIAISKQFYMDVLSQEIEHDFGNNIIFKSGLALWQVPEKHQLRDSFFISGSKNRALELYFETTEINSIYEKIEQQKYAFNHKLIEESWGQKNFRFYDPDDNLIEIGESLKTFLNRMFTEGMTLDEITVKTGVPAETIKEIIE